jgi:hypothetical protein
MTAILIIALAVVVGGACIILAKSSARREKAWRDMIRRRAEDSDRELMFMRPDDDSTATLPVIEEGK